MATIHSTEEIKKDVEELAKIAVEDKISKQEIATLYKNAAQGARSYIERHLKHQIIVSDIVDRNIMTRRFADKVLSFFPKYEHRDVTLLLECTLLVYDKHVTK
jgi:hypothetical protein